MRKWLLEYYGSSVFNTCTQQPMPCMSGPPLEIHVDDDAKLPIAHKPIPVSPHWEDDAYKELLQDQRLDIIERVPYGEPVKCCFQMVLTRKHNGKPRRTVDISPLNKFCKRETHPGETPFCCARRIPRNTWKTVTDAWNGFHSIPLRESDRYLTTFITPWGRWRYKRGVQGYLSTGDAYNRRFDAILADFTRKECVTDDTCHYDPISDLENHWWRTIDYLTTVGNAGVILNPDKLQFAQREVDFAGFRVGETSIEPLPKYFNAISEFPTPISNTDIRSWFGLVNQVANYAQLRDMMAPFKPFLSPKVKFNWTPELNTAFTKSKEAIIQAIHKGVQIFDITKPTCLRIDWSAKKKGIGYFLLQKHCSCPGRLPGCCQNGWQITLAGSRFLKSTEQRYAPVEGESLAIAWGLEQTRFFTQGCDDLVVVTDHKPLVKIFGDRTLDEISNTRIFRLKQRTLPWRFKVVHLPGKTNHAADALSRHPAPSGEVHGLSLADEMEEILISAIHGQIEKVTTISWDCIVKATQEDPALRLLLEKIESGTLPEICPREDIIPYWQYRKSLYTCDGVIMYKDRVVMPPSLRQSASESLHAAHQSVSTMEQRARDIIFWPGMTADIQRIRDACTDCNKIAPSQPSLPSAPSKPPSTPFEQIVADYFNFGGRNHLIVADRLSAWVEIFAASSGTAASGAAGLIAHLRKFFGTFGVPEEMSSDGGPEFRAKETSDFLARWGVHHRVSSSYYPQSNGRAEVAVKTAKRLLQSNIGPNGTLNNDKLLRALLQLRNTPDPDCGLSPAQIVFGKPLKDAFSFVNRLEKFSNPAIRPLWRNAWSLKESALRTRFIKTSEKLSKHTRLLPPLQVGDRCFIQNQTGSKPKRWDKSGLVLEVLNHNQYKLKVDGSGRVTLRNRKFLRKFTPASMMIQSPHLPPPVPVSMHISMPASPEPIMNSAPQLEPPPQCVEHTVPTDEGDVADADHAVTNAEDHGLPTQLTPQLDTKKKLPRELRNLMPHNMSPKKPTADGSQTVHPSGFTDSSPCETLSARPRRIIKPVKRYDAQSGT